MYGKIGCWIYGLIGNSGLLMVHNGWLVCGKVSVDVHWWWLICCNRQKQSVDDILGSQTSIAVIFLAFSSGFVCSLRYRLCWCSTVGTCSGVSYFDTDARRPSEAWASCRALLTNLFINHYQRRLTMIHIEGSGGQHDEYSPASLVFVGMFIDWFVGWLKLTPMTTRIPWDFKVFGAASGNCNHSCISTKSESVTTFPNICSNQNVFAIRFFAVHFYWSTRNDPLVDGEGCRLCRHSRCTGWYVKYLTVDGQSSA